MKEKINLNGPDSERDRGAWLDWRFDHITATDLAKILGESPFGTIVDVFYAKVNRIETRPANAPSLEYFLALEAIAADRYCDLTGREVRRAPTRQHREIPYIGCTIDRQIIKHERGPGILEIKTSSPEFFEQIKLVGPPKSYLLQTMQNCAVWGYSWGSLGIMNRNSGEILDPIDFDFDAGLWSSLLPVLADFWDHVQRGVEPPSDLAEGRVPRLPAVAGKLKELEGDGQAKLEKLVGQHKQLGDTVKESEGLQKIIKGQIGDLMTEAEADVAEVPGFRVFNTEVKGRPSLNKKLLVQRHPEVDLDEFTATPDPKRSVRMFAIKRESV